MVVLPIVQVRNVLKITRTILGTSPFNVSMPPEIRQARGDIPDNGSLHYDGMAAIDIPHDHPRPRHRHSGAQRRLKHPFESPLNPQDSRKLEAPLTRRTPRGIVTDKRSLGENDMTVALVTLDDPRPRLSSIDLPWRGIVYPVKRSKLQSLHKSNHQLTTISNYLI